MRKSHHTPKTQTWWIPSVRKDVRRTPMCDTNVSELADVANGKNFQLKQAIINNDNSH